MYYPIPLIDTIKWVFPSSSSQTLPPNDLIDSKLDEMNNALYAHESQISNLAIFSELYTQKYSLLKLENEQKVCNIEKALNEQTMNSEAQVRRLKAVNQNLFTHVIRLTRRTELLDSRTNPQTVKK